MTNESYFEEEKPAHYWHTQIPNCLDDAELDPHEFRVYLHIKRICGEDGGKCFQSHKNMADHCKMSERKLQMCLKNLCKVNEKLQMPLLRKQERKKKDGSPDTSLYTVINIWNVNTKLYSKENNTEKKEGGGVVHQMHQGGAPGADKEEHIKNERSKIEKTQIPEKKPEEKPRENVQKQQTKFRNRDIPVFLRIKSIPIEKDRQILANQFSDSELSRALEDAKSFNKREKIINMSAFLTKMCKKYKKDEQKRNEESQD